MKIQYSLKKGVEEWCFAKTCGRAQKVIRQDETVKEWVNGNFQ
jgi:hypothetical protein